MCLPGCLFVCHLILLLVCFLFKGIVSHRFPEVAQPPHQLQMPSVRNRYMSVICSDFPFFGRSVNGAEISAKAGILSL